MTAIVATTGATTTIKTAIPNGSVRFSPSDRVPSAPPVPPRRRRNIFEGRLEIFVAAAECSSLFNRSLAMAVTVVDTKGLNCPLPILRLKKAMKTAAAGDTVRLLATDPGAVGDVQHYCTVSGDRLVEWKDEGGVLTFDVAKGG